MSRQQQVTIRADTRLIKILRRGQIIKIVPRLLDVAARRAA